MSKDEAFGLLREALYSEQGITYSKAEKIINKAIDAIVEAYKAELQNKEEKHGDELQALLNDMGRAISKLSGELKTKNERIEAQSSVIIACQNAILQKDERIIELEIIVQKMKSCET